MARSTLTQVQADAVSTAIEFMHGFDVIARYNTIDALERGGFVKRSGGRGGEALLTPKGLHLREELKKFSLKDIIKGRRFLAS